MNGRDVRAPSDVYSFFEETAGKQVVLKVGSKPDGSGSRDVTVVPIDDEAALRNYAWIEDNRRKVDELTGGRVAYVYLPDTHMRRLCELQSLLLCSGRQRSCHYR